MSEPTPSAGVFLARPRRRGEPTTVEGAEASTANAPREDPLSARPSAADVPGTCPKLRRPATLARSPSLNGSRRSAAANLGGRITTGVSLQLHPGRRSLARAVGRGRTPLQHDALAAPGRSLYPTAGGRPGSGGRGAGGGPAAPPGSRLPWPSSPGDGSVRLPIPNS